jgi:class 3 adenylate cyclase
VNAGEVMMRSITTGEGQTESTPIGQTTNVTERMQAVPPTGSIATNEQTRKLIEGYFQLPGVCPFRIVQIAHETARI